jgi:hypothetical protein
MTREPSERARHCRLRTFPPGLIFGRGGIIPALSRVVAKVCRENKLGFDDREKQGNHHYEANHPEKLPHRTRSHDHWEESRDSGQYTEDHGHRNFLGSDDG